MVLLVQILYRKQPWSGQWAEMFLCAGVWNRANKTSFFPQTQTHSWLFWGWMETCECLLNVLISLWFLLGWQISSIPKRCCEKVSWGRGDVLEQENKVRGMSESKDKKRWNMLGLLNFDCKFALCLECLCNSFFTVDFKLSSTSSSESATASYPWLKTLTALLEFLHNLESALNPTRNWNLGKLNLSSLTSSWISWGECLWKRFWKPVWKLWCFPPESESLSVRTQAVLSHCS